MWLCCFQISFAKETAEEAFVTYAARINYFNRLCPQEKVYLHLDNTAYFQGETVWFAANVVNASTLGEAASKVLYVELLSPTGVVLKQQKLKVVEGRCHGSFPLIDNNVQEAVEKRGAIGYPSGYYQIRAYTRAMLNFDDAGIYSRVIPVYKAPEREGDYTDPVMEKYSYKELNRPAVKRRDKPEKLNLAFYPEGGHLVAGLPCRIAFKATDENGHGVNIEDITADDGHSLTLSRQHGGMGYFTCTPRLEKNAGKVRVTYKGKSYTFILPETEPEGCTLRLDGRGADTLSVRFAATEGLRHRLMAYTLTSRGQCLLVDTLTLTDGCNRTLSVSNKPTGVYQLTLYDASGSVFAQRMFFVLHDMPTEPLTVTTENAECHPFDEIRLQLRTATPAVNTFSLAVRDAADYGTAYRDDIRTDLLLSSELKGLIEEPGWYFGDAPKEERTAALDLLMMVQGWTRYNWRQMAGVEPFTIRHYTEEGLVVDGWAFSRIREEPLPNTRIGIRLYSPDRKYKQKATVITDSLGYWSVGVQDFEGEWELFLTSRQLKKGKENRTTRIRMERSSTPALTPYKPIEQYIPGYAWKASSIDVLTEEEDTLVLPPESYLLDEVEIEGRRMYVDYCTFKAYDAAKDTELILDEGNYTYKVVDYLHEKGYDVDFETGRIMNQYTLYLVTKGRWNYTERTFVPGRELDMERVKSVIVYDRRADFASIPAVRQHLNMGTILNIINESHGGAYVVEIRLPEKSERRNFTKNSRQTTFAGYSTLVEFYAPTYPNGPVQGDKDYRRTLYWNPEVTTDSTGCATLSFYNNGYSRSLTISAEGLTKDGVPIINE
jgi:hypothetical protein